MNRSQAILLMVLLHVVSNVTCISIPTIETGNTGKQSDIINAGYEPCKPSNEVCSINNDCCSNCCTSFTYSAMTCQDECPEDHNMNDKANKTHGNVVWKSKIPGKDDEKQEEGKVIRVSPQHHVEKVPNNVEDRVKTEMKADVNMDALPDISGKTIAPKPNKDIGIRINEEDGPDSKEIETKTRENVEVGLSVINIDKDSGENKNTDIGTSIIKIGDKAKQDESGENLNTDIGTKIIKIVEYSKNKEDDNMKTPGENSKHAHYKEGTMKDLSESIPSQTIKNEKSKGLQRYNNIKVLNNKTSLGAKQNYNLTTDRNIINKIQITSNIEKPIITTKMKNISTITKSPPCKDKCGNPSLAEDIKEIFVQKIPNLLSIKPTQPYSMSKKPICKAAGSSCKQPSQCCSQCCAVSDGAFKCFDKGTDECQSWVPGKTAPQCKETGETCETHGECCLNKCTDCGHSSKCDNHAGSVCRVEGKQVTPAGRTKLCKNLGDICAEASECCTQCCAVSDGVFKCFEEGTHECQPGDNVSLSNTTIREFVEVVGFAN